MQELILYIRPQFRNNVTQDYVKVDMFSDENVTLTQVIQDVRDIDKVFTDFSQTFSLPASQINNKLFQHWYNPDIDGFDSNIQSEAIIELNYQPFKSGKIQLQEVKMKNNKPSVYKVTFFGKTVSLNNTFGEDQLDDLAWLNNFSYVNNNTNIIAGLNAGLDFTVDSVSYTDAIIYPLISRNQRYIYNSTGNFDNQGNISYNTSGTDADNFNKRGVFPEDLKPAIKASLIIKAIQEQYGITFKSSEFFDSTEFSNLYLWLCRNVDSISANSVKVINETFTCADLEPNSCTFFGATSEALFDNGKYKIEKTSSLSGFSISVEITPSSASQIYTIEVVDELTDDVLGILTGTGTQTLAVGFDFIGNEMAIGNKKEIVTRISSSVTFTFTSKITTQVFQGSFPLTEFESQYTQVAASTSTVDSSLVPTQEIPEMKIIDFLKGLFKQFNLTAFLNDSDEIVVKTLDDFYGDSTTTHDISQYVKTDENTVAEALPFSDVNFQYPEPNTKLAQAYSNIHNNRYGRLKYTSGASKRNEYNVNVPFGHILYERLQDLSSTNNTEAQYGLSVNESDNAVLPKPLLFYGIYQTSISPSINFVQSTRPESGMPSAGTQTEITNYWMPHNANELGTASTAPAFNLNFGSEINSYTLTDYGGNNNSLFQKFYQNYIVRVFNTRTRIFKYKAILPLKFLLNYSLADKVFVNGRSFTINKITTKLQTGESSLELLNEPTEWKN